MSITAQVTGVRQWLGIAAGVLICGMAWVVLSPRGGQTPLPGGVAREVEQHAEASAIDTMEIHRLERVADSAAVKVQAAVAKAQGREVIAARGVDERATAQVREVELPQVQALSVASADKDTALAWARVEAASLDSALARSEERAAQADTVLDAVVKVAEAREEPCRVLWVVPCPSRTMVLVGTAIVTAVGVARRLRTGPCHTPCMPFLPVGSEHSG
jgi:hypothetical protein